MSIKSDNVGQAYHHDSYYCESNNHGRNMVTLVIFLNAFYAFYNVLENPCNKVIWNK